MLRFGGQETLSVLDLEFGQVTSALSLTVLTAEGRCCGSSHWGAIKQTKKYKIPASLIRRCTVFGQTLEK